VAVAAVAAAGPVVAVAAVGAEDVEAVGGRHNG